MPAAIQSRIFWLSFCWLKKRIRYPEKQFCLFYAGIKFGPSHWQKNIGWGCLRIWCWGRDNVAQNQKRLYIEELLDLHSSPSIIWVIKSWRMKWARHVTCMGERKGAFRFWWGNLNERDPLDVIGIDGRIILKWIWNSMVRCGLNWSGSGYGQMVGACEHSKEPQVCDFRHLLWSRWELWSSGLLCSE